ncbi:MAG TPA: DUF6036 family nucleotidyltransferase [Methylomirabilota bacterium]|nr:DUF6036 family nucleotidyltransferase [Methylomirabilota bacterium]
MAEKLDWQGKAGQRLDEFARRLPAQQRLTITIFGSAPLQLFVESSFLSEDIDLFGDKNTTDFLEDFVEANHWGKGATDFYIQVCDPLAFKSTIDWASRAIEVERHGHLLRFVHPWDVLVSKLQRLEEKDLNAFHLVIGKTGHPTEEEWIRHLQLAVDLYRPKFDEESARGDMLMNTRILWQTLWGKDIDVRARIIRPALERAEREYRAADPNLKTRLANLRLPKEP